MNKIIKMYAQTYPNIDVYYINNGGREYVKQLFLDKSILICKLSHVIPLNFLYYTTLALEPFLSFIVVTFLFVKSLFVTIATRIVDVSNVDILFLKFDDLLTIRRCKSAGIFDGSYYWLKMPFSTADLKELENKRVFTVYELLKFGDVIKAYFYSLMAIVYVCCHNSELFLRKPYNSFEFYLTYLAMRYFPTTTKLVFPNHIDRWAVLVDHCPQVMKILVQHGIETKKANWPVKLNTVSVVYAFNKELGYDLRNALLSKDPEFRYMRSTIDLVDDENDNNYKVLIVCHPAAMRDREEYLISHLQRPDVTIYAKTHPTTINISFYEELQKKYSFHLVKGNNYPKVNRLISYRSTIVYEYQFYGIQTIMYYDYTLDEIVEKIVQEAEEWNK